ncbi:bifunctional DNA primase/polymerase [Parasphingorhabdus sp.]|uniref:bifunctional DNA primase/polymerase n=1 Tax=Parasphingorhabdus sp. TaxID=2709688 RepID=UPI003A8EE7DB
MAGAFAIWQPRYAEAGIATFPLNAVTKVPAVGNYDKAGHPASREWVKKFQDSEAFGFLCGKRSKLSILDIDTPSENFLADSLKRFGPSPIIARTPSGGFHAWYKHNGEGRKIRPEKGSPFDILGGGVAIAPPSNAGKGQYQFIQGSLNDIGLLQPMRLPVVGNDAPLPQDGLSMAQANEGKRNAALFKIALRLARDAEGMEALFNQVALANKSTMVPPLDDSEVITVAASAWDYQCAGKNWSGSGRRIVKGFDEIDAFIPKDELPHKAAPDAAFLLDLLRRLHFERNTFVVANAMHEKLGWSRKRFTAARSYLESMGKLRVVKPPAKDAPAIYAF